MSAWCGSTARLRWAMTRAGWSNEKRGVWLIIGLTVDDARTLARAANVPLAALLLPDPTRWEMFRAWLYSVRAAGSGTTRR